MGTGKLTKKRQAIWDKSNGKCWYCGCDLSVSKWQADHVIPECSIWRDREDRNYINSIKNMVPACRDCNIGKGPRSIEEFRARIEETATFFSKKSARLKLGIRYKQIKIRVYNNPVVFWFEKMGL